MIRRGKDFHNLNMKSTFKKELASPDQRVKMWLTHPDGKIYTGVCQCIVDADASSCVSYEFIKDSRERISRLRSKRIIAQFTEKVNDHCQFYATTRDLKVPGISQRQWQSKCAWKREGKKTWIVYEDTKDFSKRYPLLPGIVLATSKTTWLMEELPKLGSVPQTRVTLVTNNKLNGSAPTYATNILAKRFAGNIMQVRMDEK